VGYHHGDLPRALLEAAEQILERDGLAGISLRATARASGVSHAAPKNHYGSLAGLLSALAASGFERLRANADAALDERRDRPDRLHLLAICYVQFARDHPGLFALMFRSERLDLDSPELRSASAALLDLFASASGEDQQPTLSLISAKRMALAWAQVHGLAVLLLEGQLAPLIARTAEDCSESEFLTQVLARNSEA
jgi:AcrR family transcriptional regulator